MKLLLLTDKALFQIHMKRIALWDRMTCLERDANVADNDVAWAQVNSAHHLDASKLALECAEDLRHA